MQNKPESFVLKPIGYLKSCYPEKFGTPRQSGLVQAAVGQIDFLPHVQPELSLIGLSEFSHIWVIFVFHKNGDVRYHAKVHPPRLGGDTIGLFASRTPHRPNPIGLSLVKLQKVHTNSVTILGLDMIDGTPVLDIKPYLGETESIPDARNGWVGRIPTPSVNVEWGPTARQQLQALHQNSDFKSLIEETIRLDPRPLVYKNLKSPKPSYRQTHIVRIQNWDIHFRFENENQIQIEFIESIAQK